MAAARQKELQMPYMLNFLGVAGSSLNPGTLGDCWNWCDSSTCEAEEHPQKGPSCIAMVEGRVGSLPLHQYKHSGHISTPITPRGGGIDPLMRAATRLTPLGTAVLDTSLCGAGYNMDS